MTTLWLCFTLLSKQQREKVFHGFWSTSSFDVQNAYLCGCVKVPDIKRHYTSKGTASRRNLTQVYYVYKGPVTVRVCKVVFLRIHAVSNGRVFRALQAQKEGNGAPKSAVQRKESILSVIGSTARFSMKTTTLDLGSASRVKTV